jgi:hypothetical protein
MEQSWDGRSDMLILRLNSQNRMVTKGYRKGVYEWVRKVRGLRTYVIGITRAQQRPKQIPAVPAAEVLAASVEHATPRNSSAILRAGGDPRINVQTRKPGTESL